MTLVKRKVHQVALTVDHLIICFIPQSPFLQLDFQRHPLHP